MINKLIIHANAISRVLNEQRSAIVIAFGPGLEDVVASLKLGLEDRQQELHAAKSALDLYVQHTHNSLKLTRCSCVASISRRVTCCAYSTGNWNLDHADCVLVVVIICHALWASDPCRSSCD